MGFLKIFLNDWLFKRNFKAEILWLTGADLHDNDKIKYPGLFIYEERKEYNLDGWIKEIDLCHSNAYSEVCATEAQAPPLT